MDALPEISDPDSRSRANEIFRGKSTKTIEDDAVDLGLIDAGIYHFFRHRTLEARRGALEGFLLNRAMEAES